MIKRADLPALLIGMMATLAGIGIARFAYTPLIPTLVQAGWFPESQAVYLGAANLLGYLAGALAAHRLSERIPLRTLMALSFATVALSFILCARAASFEWFFCWRLLAGIAGAMLMVLGPATALTATPPTRRAAVGAFLFTGIGLGAVLSALLVPLLMHASLSATWLTLGALTALAGLVCDRGLVSLAGPSTATSPVASPSDTRRKGTRWLLFCVMAAYALDAIGFIPHTVFWADYLARERALGTVVSATQWALFGVGAICGPLLAGWLAHRVGWQRGLSLAFSAKAIAVALPLLSVAVVSRSLSSFIVGALVPGIVALTSGRIAELVGPAEHKRYWGLATAMFAAAQALSGYTLSALYAAWGSYSLLFLGGSAALAAGALLIILSDYYPRYRSPSTT